MTFKLKVTVKIIITKNCKIVLLGGQMMGFFENWRDSWLKAMSFDPLDDSIQITKSHVISTSMPVIPTITFLLSRFPTCRFNTISLVKESLSCPFYIKCTAWVWYGNAQWRSHIRLRGGSCPPIKFEKKKFLPIILRKISICLPLKL